MPVARFVECEIFNLQKPVQIKFCLKANKKFYTIRKLKVDFKNNFEQAKCKINANCSDDKNTRSDTKNKYEKHTHETKGALHPPEN